MVKVPKGYRSRNVEDRRGSGGRSGGGGFGFPRRSSGGGSLGGGGLGGSMGGGGLGGSLGGAGAPATGRRGCGGGLGLIMLLVLGLLLFSCLSGGGGINPGSLDTGGPAAPAPQVDSPEYAGAEDLVNFVLDDVQDFWTDEFARAGQTYPEAQLVLFDRNVRTGGCGSATAAVGPFYCPADQKAYIDLQYLLILQDQLGAEGDFSQAYIVAHEIGHHVQNVLGTNQAVREAQSGASRAESNSLQVQMELQADCLAGMWARRADQQGLLDAGDLAEGVRAASAVGDDAITGSTNQENFTHGSSAQRIKWFEIGFQQGVYDACDTFQAARDGNL